MDSTAQMMQDKAASCGAGQEMNKGFWVMNRLKCECITWARTDGNLSEHHLLCPNNPDCRRADCEFFDLGFEQNCSGEIRGGTAVEFCQNFNGNIRSY